MAKQRTASPRPGPTGVLRPGEWSGAVPVATRNYLAHVEKGQTIRALAKEADVHPSTILRRVRRVEALRDDPLLDNALRRLADPIGGALVDPDGALRRQAAPILRQLSEPGTVLAIAKDMEKGVVAREGPDGEPVRIGVVERMLAEEMAVRGWIASTSAEARVQRYRITHKGRLSVRGSRARAQGLAEEAANFSAAPEAEDDRLHHMRSGLIDTPLQNLSRRRDETGEPFLSRDLVAAGERLQDDFQVASERGDPLPDWDEFLEDLPDSGMVRTPGTRPADRLLRALRELGPGLADAAFRCCCLLEGLETVEKRMNWSARSGKVVLRLALWRLQTHYRAEDARASPLIG